MLKQLKLLLFFSLLLSKQGEKGQQEEENGEKIHAT
jgi:hypothetical protein